MVTESPWQPGGESSAFACECGALPSESMPKVSE
jgi:hypothetical protein